MIDDATNDSALWFLGAVEASQHDDGLMGGKGNQSSTLERGGKQDGQRSCMCDGSE